MDPGIPESVRSKVCDIEGQRRGGGQQPEMGTRLWVGRSRLADANRSVPISLWDG